MSRKLFLNEYGAPITVGVAKKPIWDYDYEFKVVSLRPFKEYWKGHYFEAGFYKAPTTERKVRGILITFTGRNGNLHENHITWMEASELFRQLQKALTTPPGAPADGE